MSNQNRRSFLKNSAGLAAGVSVASAVPGCSLLRILGINDEIRVGVVGIRSKGRQLITEFQKLEKVRVTAICDVDQNILAERRKEFEQNFGKIEVYTDVRKLLEKKDIDAVVIATPNHTHALFTIWACQAGKDVYVEKPISHNVWEGRKIVEAARKYNCIVQSGTQNRSDTGLRKAVDYIHQGNLGEIKWIHSIWYRMRNSIGKVNHEQTVPDYIDYDLWTGPAPMKPLMRKNLHYDWHWIWDTGNGDMGNLGTHQIDDARFILGNPGLPKRIASYGGRFLFNDDGQTPNTQTAYFDYDKTPVILELRNLTMKKGLKAMDHLRGIRMGSIVQCEHGYFAGGRGGGWAYNNDGEKIIQFPGDGGIGHPANFIEAVRQRRPEILHADAEQGHISASLCHFANISYRIGEPAGAADIKSIWDIEQAVQTSERIEAHLRANEIDLNDTGIKAGPWLEIDKDLEQVKGGFAAEANRYIKREYREPYTINDNV